MNSHLPKDGVYQSWLAKDRRLQRLIVDRFNKTWKNENSDTCFEFQERGRNEIEIPNEILSKNLVESDPLHFSKPTKRHQEPHAITSRDISKMRQVKNQKSAKTFQSLEFEQEKLKHDRAAFEEQKKIKYANMKSK